MRVSFLFICLDYTPLRVQRRELSWFPKGQMILLWFIEKQIINLFHYKYLRARQLEELSISITFFSLNIYSQHQFIINFSQFYDNQTIRNSNLLYKFIMFHHQKSSSSSDANLQINLLQPKDRDSRVNFVRVQHRNQHLLNVNMVPIPPRGSEHIERQTTFKNDIEPNIYQNYSVLENVDFSESLLTSPNNNNRVVGVILFILLIAFTPLETLALYTSQQIMLMTDLFPMIQFLLICELVAFGLLYYFNWVQNIRVLTNYMRAGVRQSQDPSLNLISKIALRPYILFLLTIFATVIWQVSYAGALLEHEQKEHLLVFYVIILPQIAASLYFEQQLHKNKKILIIFYLIMIYLIVCAGVQSSWLLLNSVTGLILIYFSIRAGRMCLFMEYIAKFVMLILIAIMHIFSLEQEQDPDDNDSPSMQTIMTLSIVSCLCIIIVRCLNNKILRVQLYKYFYSDTFINNALLCLPLALSYIQSEVIDLWVGVLGCGALFIIGYKVDKEKHLICLESQLKEIK